MLFVPKWRRRHTHIYKEPEFLLDLNKGEAATIYFLIRMFPSDKIIELFVFRVRILYICSACKNKYL